MQIKKIAAALENFAPLPLQEGYDNAGLQCGLTASECSGALLCLDVTEAVVQEAVDRGYNLIVAHHPLLFRGVKCVSDKTYVERTLRKAIQNDVAIYAAHTNLDNAVGGVNYEIAQHLGLQDVDFLEPLGRGDQPAGSGLVGNLPQPMDAMDFLQLLKREFKVENLHFSRGFQQTVQRIAFCGLGVPKPLEQTFSSQEKLVITTISVMKMNFGSQHSDIIKANVTPSTSYSAFFRSNSLRSAQR